MHLKPKTNHTFIKEKTYLMKTKFTILFLLLAIAANAQKIRFAKHGNHWASTGYHFINNFHRCISFGGDTIYNGKTYLQSIITGFSTPNLLIREDTNAGIVYYCNPFSPSDPLSDTLDHVLYNYNLHIGDTIRYHIDYATFVTDTLIGIDSVRINGAYHKQFSFLRTQDLPGASSLYYNVLEGVGCLAYPFFPVTCGNNFEYGECIVCFSHYEVYPAIQFQTFQDFHTPDTFNNVHCIYTDSVSCPIYLNTPNQIILNFNISLSPNPANEQITISSNIGFANNTLVSVFDYTGNCVYKAMLQPGKKEEEMNTTHWLNGVYMVNIQSNMGQSSVWKKVVVLH